jgi:hypothetical protein
VLFFNVTVRVVGSVSVVVNISYCLFTLTIVETGKNAVEAIKDYILEVVNGVCEALQFLDYRSRLK